ncbi:MAG TPA: RcnB family protein [Micropepsaceae bacterium]|nr:RcnB family protein [Micropepsaceae bacterium]
MKTLISAAALALSLFGIAGAANAQPYYAHGPAFHREVVRHYPGRAWVRGERFVPGYGRFIVVDDWRGYRLPRPIFGAHWVRAGGQFLLISNSTGRIIDIRFF